MKKMPSISTPASFDKPTTSKSSSEPESIEYEKDEEDSYSGDEALDEEGSKVKIKRENSSSNEAHEFKEPLPVEPAFKMPIATVKKEPTSSSSSSSSSSKLSNVFKVPSSEKSSEKRKLSALDEIMEVYLILNFI
jgi:hypothetical protein